MQTLYIAEFDVEATAGTSLSDVAPSDVAPTGAMSLPHAVALECLARWLSLGGDEVIPAVFEEDGELTLPPDKFRTQRRASWELARTEGIEALRLEVRDNRAGIDGLYITRITVGTMDSRTTVRVVMAHDSATQWLSPSQPPDVYQPRIVRSLAMDTRITLRVEEQVQDSRYIHIRTDAEVGILAEVLRSPRRLPILLVHARSLHALRNTRRAAEGLIGLVRTITVDLRAARLLGTVVPDLEVPHAGACIVWSDLNAARLTFAPDEVSGSNRDHLRSAVMKRVAPLSVIARGQDRVFSSARQKILEIDLAAAVERASAAAADGDLAGQVSALTEQRDLAEVEARTWKELARGEEEESGRWRAQAQTLPGLQQQIVRLTQERDQMLVALAAVPRIPVVVVSDPWSLLPLLVTANEDSAVDLFLQLEDLTEGHLVFTPRAASSWKKAKYPYPQEMRDDLIKLARAAVSLYDGSARKMPHLDTWIRQEFDLKVAFSDDHIERTSQLRYFTFEGQRYDRTPHVKVRDFAPPQEVGRIHFATDPLQGRFVVDWVALKLYGL